MGVPPHGPAPRPRILSRRLRALACPVPGIGDENDGGKSGPSSYLPPLARANAPPRPTLRAPGVTQPPLPFSSAPLRLESLHKLNLSAARIQLPSKSQQLPSRQVRGQSEALCVPRLPP